CRQTRHLELGELDEYDTRPSIEQWNQLWDELQYWNEQRPPAMLPIKTTGTGGGQIFPEIFFAHWAAISSNQLYHTACIMMLEIKPAGRLPPPSMPHCANLINAIQPLFIAGKLLSHRSEHLSVARLFKIIDKTTGWGAMWRLKDLERVWGYDPGEIISAMSRNGWDDYDDRQGFLRISANDINDIPTYLSVDVDVVDPGLAPGTGTPKPRRWTNRELIRILRNVDGYNVGDFLPDCTVDSWLTLDRTAAPQG
ncbi:hypothetical protein V502_07500, partial [Pseudogymnoascus sp. VKM F-4520 (FW-2644)]